MNEKLHLQSERDKYEKNKENENINTTLMLLLNVS